MGIYYYFPYEQSLYYSFYFPETIASDVDENLDKKAYKEDKTSLNQRKTIIPFITK